MKSHVTSYNGLFAQRFTETPKVERIEIPLIQRDYAQGRKGAKVQRIRDDFLDILHRAVIGAAFEHLFATEPASSTPAIPGRWCSSASKQASVSICSSRAAGAMGPCAVEIESSASRTPYFSTRCCCTNCTKLPISRGACAATTMCSMSAMSAGILFQLEDHPILRGSVSAFNLAGATLEQRAGVFHRLFSDATCWPAITGAMLAVGDYSRQLNRRFFQFGSGSNEAPWRELLTGAARSHLEGTRDVLGSLLDEVAQTDSELGEYLDAIQTTWLQAPT